MVAGFDERDRTRAVKPAAAVECDAVPAVRGRGDRYMMDNCEERARCGERIALGLRLFRAEIRRTVGDGPLQDYDAGWLVDR